MNEQERKNVLEKAAKEYRWTMFTFKDLVKKFKTDYPDDKFDDSGCQWNESDGLDNFTNLFSRAEDLFKIIDAKFDKPYKGRLPSDIIDHRDVVNKNIENLKEIMDNGSGENDVEQAKQYLDYINANTDHGIYAVSQYFDSFKNMHYRSDQIDKYLNYMNEKLNKLVAKYKKIFPSYDYKEPKDFFDVRDRIEEIYKSASEKADITMDKGKSTKFEDAIYAYSDGSNNFKDIEEGFNDFYETVYESVSSVRSIKDKAALLKFMNKKLGKLVGSDEFKMVFPDYKYESQADFNGIESSLYGIYETACLKNMKEVDESKVSAFRDALKDETNLNSIRNSFVEEYECASKAVSGVSKLSSKKSDLGLKRKFDTIYETKVLPLFIENSAKKYSKGFKKMHMSFKEVKKSCPKFYKFMESICTKNKIKEEEFSGNTLLVVLFASCYAADNMAIADAVCRGLRKITKDPELKIDKWNKLRETIKTKASESDDTEDLRKVMEPKLNELSCDSTLVKTILDVAKKTSHKQKKTSHRSKYTIKLFSFGRKK